MSLKCIESLLFVILEFASFDKTLEMQLLERSEVLILSTLKYIHLIGNYTVLVENVRGEAVEDMQAKRMQKKMAKQKMKALQLAAFRNDMKRKNAVEDDSDDEEDDIAKQISKIQEDFMKTKDVIDNLFKFMRD